jgi:hypothetical protein
MKRLLPLLSLPLLVACQPIDYKAECVRYETDMHAAIIKAGGYPPVGASPHGEKVFYELRPEHQRLMGEVNERYGRRLQTSDPARFCSAYR